MGYSVMTGMRCSLKRRKIAGDKSIYGKAEYKYIKSKWQAYTLIGYEN